MKIFIAVLLSLVILSAGHASTEIFVDLKRAPLPLDGGLSDGQLALTFDDGPDPVTTLKILDILKKYNVQAVFFEVGNVANQHPEVTQAILEQGHSLGSHSWDHQDLTTLPLTEALKNIEEGHRAVESAAGRGFQSIFFRFPFFSSTPELMTGIEALGLISFPANIVTEDWMTPDPKELLAKSLAMIDNEKHGIILFHDVQPQVADMLDSFLAEISARAYETIIFRQPPRRMAFKLGH